MVIATEAEGDTVSVLAERLGKLSVNGSTGPDGHEDTLTNAVFGALRYLPAEQALKAFVSLVTGTVSTGPYVDSTVTLWPHLQSTRTMSGYVEPDAVIIVGDLVICVEAKYKAGFGCFTDPGDGGGSLHQLAVQAEALAQRPDTMVNRRLLMVAITDAAACPEKEFEQAEHDMVRLGMAPDRVTLAWAGWHQIGALLANLTDLRPHEATLRDDVLDYLRWRNVMAVYEPIGTSDWASMGQMASIGSQCVFPAIAVFQRNLEAALVEDGIVWGHLDSGVNFSSSRSLFKPSGWFPGRVSFAWWPKRWPDKPGAVKGAYPGLYTCFDFTSNCIEIGFMVAPGSAAIATKTWLPQAAGLARELNMTSLVGAEVAIPKSAVAPTVLWKPAGEVDDIWLREHFFNLLGALMLRKRLPADSTVSDAHRALLEIRDAVDRCPTLRRLLYPPGDHLSLAGSVSGLPTAALDGEAAPTD